MLSGCIEKEKVFIRVSYAQAWIQSMECSCVAPQILHQRIILKWSWLAGLQGLSRSEHKFSLSREASKYCPSKVPPNAKGNECHHRETADTIVHRVKSPKTASARLSRSEFKMSIFNMFRKMRESI